MSTVTINQTTNINNVKETVKEAYNEATGTSPYRPEAAELETYLKAQGQQSPNEFTMKTMHDFITEGDPFSYASVYGKFINELRGFFLCHKIRQQFLQTSNATEVGLEDYLNSLEKLFFALQDPKVDAEITRFGLLTNPEQYNNPEWDGIEGVMQPYRKA